MLIKHNSSSAAAKSSPIDVPVAPPEPPTPAVAPMKVSPKPKKTPAKSPSYEVGYGKPPKHTQFKPKQSGNPKGRPRQPPALSDVLARELAKVVTVTLDKKPTKISQGELAVMALMRSAMGGNLGALKTIATAWALLPAEAGPKSVMTKDELELLQAVITEQLSGNKAEALDGEPGSSHA